MKIICKNCNIEIPVQRIDIFCYEAKCNICLEKFTWEKGLPEKPSNFKVKIYKLEHRTEIIFPRIRFSFGLLFLICFAFAWNVFMFLSLGIELKETFEFLIYPIFWIVGISFFIYTLKLVFGKDTILLNNSNLTLIKKILVFRRTYKFELNQIKKIGTITYVRKDETGHETYSQSPTIYIKNGNVDFYEYGKDEEQDWIVAYINYFLYSERKIRVAKETLTYDDNCEELFTDKDWYYIKQNWQNRPRMKRSNITTKKIVRGKITEKKLIKTKDNDYYNKIVENYKLRLDDNQIENVPEHVFNASVKGANATIEYLDNKQSFRCKSDISTQTNPKYTERRQIQINVGETKKNVDLISLTVFDNYKIVELDSTYFMITDFYEEEQFRYYSENLPFEVNFGDVIELVADCQTNNIIKVKAKIK